MFNSETLMNFLFFGGGGDGLMTYYSLYFRMVKIVCDTVVGNVIHTLIVNIAEVSLEFVVATSGNAFSRCTRRLCDVTLFGHAVFGKQLHIINVSNI